MNIKNLLAMTAVATLLTTTMACNTDNQPNTCGNNTQAVIENIMTRTSVRQFSERQIADDTLNILVKAGMAAPTAINRQPWSFIIVTQREVLDSLMSNHHHSNLETATAAIVVCGDLSKTPEDFTREYWIQDCSAATENILLAAHAYGLGAVWCGVYPNPDVLPGVSRVLGLPENIVPLNIISLGYPASETTPKDKWKPENVHYQRW